MNRKEIVIIFVVLCFVSAKSQVYKLMTFPEKIEKRYIINPLADEERYRKKVKKKIPRKYLKPYTYMLAFNKADIFKDGEIYLGWKSMEDHINLLLDSILPANLKTKKIHAYIGRNSEMNAGCLYDGTMIVNVGLIAEVKNEAALMAVLSHELAHYIKNHLLDEYIASVTEKRKKQDDEFDLALKRKGFAQQLELQADSLGFAILKNAGYDVSQANTNFELFIREKEYSVKRRKSDLVSDDSVNVKTKKGTFTANTLEKLLSTHPDEKERKEKLAAFIKANPGGKKIISKLDEDYFAFLQKQARLESIGLIFASHNYTECLERAFRFYLFEPGEITYQYYIAESIRRICLLDYTLRKQGFLAENLTNSGFKDGEGILHDLKCLIPNDEQFKKVKALDLKTAKPPFETYQEAFYYFNNKLVKSNYAEAYLMAALFENNKSKQQKNIDKYLSNSKSERKEYAKKYFDKSLSSSVINNPGEIVMVPQVDYYSHSRYTKYGSFGRLRYNYGKSELVGAQLATTISDAMNSRLSDTKSISLPQASKESFNTKEKYEEIILTTFLAQREENEGYNVVHYYKELENEDYIGKVDIFRLNPEVWDFFNTNKIKNIMLARYSRHLSEADKVLRRPAFWFGFPTVGFTWLFLPLRVAHYKKLEVLSYDSRAGEVLYFSKIKPYRLNSHKGIRMFRKMRREKAEFIKDNYKTSAE